MTGPDLAAARGHWVHRLDPAAFAVVMATGIVSEAVHLVGLDALSVTLFVLACGLHVALVAVTAVRVARWPGAVAADARDPRRAFGFLTFVAATGVLGSRFALDGHAATATALVAVTVAGWVLLTVTVPAAVLLGGHESALLDAVGGGWFMAVVATQSVAVGTADLAALTTPRPWLVTTSMVAWSLGVALYGLVAALVVVALLRRPVRPDSLSPTHWISMGGTAITVLAGSRILHVTREGPLPDLRPVVEGTCLVLWSWGTWLVPLLVVASAWRHRRTVGGTRYEVGLWSVVFPLGMYAVASRAFATATGMGWLLPFSRVASWAGLVAWLVVAGSFLRARRRGPAPA